MLAEVPMIRRVAERKAERIGRRLRLDMITAQKRQSVAFLLQAVEGRADNVARADRIMDEALPAVRDSFLPVTHVLLEDVAKLTAGKQLHEQAVRLRDAADEAAGR